MLSPGSYQFQGKYKGDLVSERGLEWHVVCAAKEQNVIGRGVVSRSTTAQWQDLEFTFSVPEADCPAQYVKLVFDARSASERFISGNIWFDDFKIARQEPTVATPPTGCRRLPGTPQPTEATGSLHTGTGRMPAAAEVRRHGLCNARRRLHRKPLSPRYHLGKLRQPVPSPESTATPR